ncbi:hypothetical protein LUZ62_030431 [Rhynchospora pubera]|uniref:HMA domain-containing protein n=1 Tax=Rhynchospora pubera TaxID=906938 RepID=A0AAV8HJ16_9POAL|nr:hypothetical protein LUZ62_030431 [Rhynchospora pubera]
MHGDYIDEFGRTKTLQSDSTFRATKILQKEIIVELKVYMHCPACEKLVYKTLRKFKGVAAVKVDMEEHQAIVYGKFKIEKLLKKLKDKAGKRAEIVRIEEEESQENYEGHNYSCNEFFGVNGYENYENDAIHQDSNMLDGYNEDHIVGDITLFNDDNTNACIIL